MRDEWGDPRPLWTGDGFSDLHDGRGTVWRKDARGTWARICDCHRPQAITEARKREAAERHLAEHRGRPWTPLPPPVTEGATPTPETCPAPCHIPAERRVR